MRSAAAGKAWLEWEQRAFKCRPMTSAIEGGRLGLQVLENIPKGGVSLLVIRVFLLVEMCHACVIWFGFFLAGLIAFAWGRTRVTDEGVPEDIFNPIYGGCFERLLRLHRFCFHSWTIHVCL